MRLLVKTFVEGSRQQIPYPAPIWEWKCVQKYQWQESQHINVLELTAFFIYFGKACCEKSFQHIRAFHIFDSRVCSCVVAKGRSSSSFKQTLKTLLRFGLGFGLVRLTSLDY